MSPKRRRVWQVALTKPRLLAPRSLVGAAVDPEITRLEERCRRLERDIRQSELERRNAMERLLRAEEQERRRLAAELHDDTVQVLAACLVALDHLEQTVETADRRRITTVVTAARRTLAAATDRTRRLMFELRPTSLQDEGLAGALRDLADQVGEEAGLKVTVSVPEERYSYVVEEIAYRTVREAIVNVRKHARAASLESQGQRSRRPPVRPGRRRRPRIRGRGCPRAQPPAAADGPGRDARAPRASPAAASRSPRPPGAAPSSASSCRPSCRRSSQRCGGAADTTSVRGGGEAAMCSRVSSAARLPSPAATASTMRSWSSAQYSTRRGSIA